MTIDRGELASMLNGAIDRYDDDVAELIGCGPFILEAQGHIALALQHSDSTDPEEKLFAAELLEEAALIALCNAQMMRAGTKT